MKHVCNIIKKRKTIIENIATCDESFAHRYKGESQQCKHIKGDIVPSCMLLGLSVMISHQLLLILLKGCAKSICKK
jgi:hypothetical protein